jgi:hypothetical protein
MLRRRVAIVVAPVLALGSLGLLAQAGGTPPVRVDLRSGGAWVASTVGLMTLIDGSSAQVVARVDVGDGSPDLTAVQSGAVGYAVDGGRGTVVRVDPRTFAAGPPTAVVADASGRVVARAGDRSVYVVDEGRGRVAVADAGDLTVRRGDEVSLADGVRSSVVDRDGRLWLLGETSGDLVWFDGPERHTRPRVVDDPAGAELVVAGGVPVIVDRAGRSVRRIGRDGGDTARACIDMRGDDDSIRFGAAAGGDRVYAVSGDQGVLRVSDLATGGCASVAVTVAGAGSELGAPVEVGGRVFVPDFTTGKVAVVDVDRDRMVVTDQPVAEGRFELFVQDGFVFFNDPDSERAGVIHVDGSVSRVVKYDPADPDAGVDNDAGALAALEPAPEPPADPATSPDAPDDTSSDAAPTTAPDAPDPTGAPVRPDPVPGPSPDDTRPARPGEVPPTGTGATTTTTSGGTASTPSSSGSTTSSSTTPSSTPTSSTTTEDTTPTTSCPGPDNDRDGIPDSCDFDDDGDTVTDDLDVCPGFDDRLDQDDDGNPDGCDNTDGSPPIVTIVDVTTVFVNNRPRRQVTVHAEDPQTGVSHIEVAFSYERRLNCTGPLETVSVGPIIDSADGVEDFVATFSIPTCPNGGSLILEESIEATASNPEGVTSAPVSG